VGPPSTLNPEFNSTILGNRRLNEQNCLIRLALPDIEPKGSADIAKLIVIVENQTIQECIGKPVHSFFLWGLGRG